MDAFERPSTWALALGIGALAAGASALGDVGHVLRPAVYYLLVAVVAAGGTLGLVHGIPTLLGLVTLGLSVARDWQATFQTQVAAVVDDETEPDVAPDPGERLRGWGSAVEKFLLAGEAGGFSIRRMAGVTGSDTWALLTSWLAEQGILANYPGRGYDWAEEMTLARALNRLRGAALPYPPGPAPIVNWSYNDATRRNAARQAATPQKPAAQAVIDQP